MEKLAVSLRSLWSVSYPETLSLPHPQPIP
jgi:hypothetical protein